MSLAVGVLSEYQVLQIIQEVLVAGYQVVLLLIRERLLQARMQITDEILKFG